MFRSNISFFINRPETTLLLVLVAITFLSMFGFGFIDEPVFKSKLKGRVNNCIFSLPKFSYGGKIICTAKLDNDLTVSFESFTMMKPGDEVTYAEYERSFTHMTKYIQVY